MTTRKIQAIQLIQTSDNVLYSFLNTERDELLEKVLFILSQMHSLQYEMTFHLQNSKYSQRVSEVNSYCSSTYNYYTINELI